jgi:hypothetical protein
VKNTGKALFSPIRILYKIYALSPELRAQTLENQELALIVLPAFRLHPLERADLPFSPWEEVKVKRWNSLVPLHCGMMTLRNGPIQQPYYLLRQPRLASLTNQASVSRLSIASALLQSMVQKRSVAGCIASGWRKPPRRCWPATCPQSERPTFIHIIYL